MATRVLVLVYAGSAICCLVLKADVMEAVGSQHLDNITARSGGLHGARAAAFSASCFPAQKKTNKWVRKVFSCDNGGTRWEVHAARHTVGGSGAKVTGSSIVS
jgi:hypothetical protein